MTTTLITRPATDTETGIPFGRLLRVEWGKSTDTRAARWLILITAVGTAAIMLAPLLARHSIEQRYDRYLQFAGLGVAAILPVVSILTLTTEWTQRTVLTTFTQEPRRSRVITAKVSVAMLLTLGAIGFGLVVTGIALAVAAGTGRHLDADLTVGNVVGYVLFVLVNIAIGVAFGALLQNSAAAIVLYFLLPALFGIVGAAVHPLSRWVDPGTVFGWLLQGEYRGHLAPLAVSTVLWLVLPLAAGLARTARREIV